MKLRLKSLAPIAISLTLFLITLLTYRPVLDCDFVNYDDNGYVTENPQVQAGLSSASIAWAFRTGQECNWHPLTWLSHMTDCSLFGLNPRGHHLTNLVFHLANTLLVFFTFWRLTGSLWTSAALAGFFGLHPAHVESVAWIAERKDVLSTFFFLLTIWAYSRYAEGAKAAIEHPTSNAERRTQGQDSAGPGARRSKTENRKPKIQALFYVFSLLFFALGLMSKPMLVTLPFVLLLLDYWPLARLQQPAEEPNAPRPSRSTLTRLVLEKLPFFALAGLSSLVTLVAQGRGGLMVSLQAAPFPARCINALASYLRYAAELCWPHKLAVLYPYSREWPVWPAACGAIGLVALALAAVKWRRSAPYLLVGGFWFVGTLVPVIGLVQVGEQARADRYTYIPSIGFFLLCCWGVSHLLSGRPLGKLLLGGGAALALGACAVLTRQQLPYWQNTIALFEHAIEVTRDNSTAHASLGGALDGANRLEEAIRQYQIALAIYPGNVLAHNNYGVGLARLGRFDEAISHYEAALALAPKNAEAHFNLANACNPSYVDPRSGAGVAPNPALDARRAREHYQIALQLNPRLLAAYVNWGNLELGAGDYPKARSLYEQALRLEPHSWLALCNMGNVLSKLGKTNDAIATFEQAVQSRPGDAATRVRLGNLLAETARFEEAVPQFQSVVKIQPTNSQAWNNLGGAFAKLGQLDAAEQCLEQLIRLRPDKAQAHANLARVLASAGKLQRASAEYGEALRLEPQNPEVHRQLGLFLEKTGRRSEAVEQLSTAVQLKPEEPDGHYELGVALAQIGKSRDAAQQFQEALRLQPDWTAPLNDLAWLLATDADAGLRNGTEAVKLAQRACELTTNQDANALGTLDAAYAEAGQFELAIQTARKARDRARATGRTNLVETAAARLKLYSSGKPFHQERTGHNP